MKVLITGATSGIGYNLAINLIKKGHYVILTTHNNQELETLKEKLKAVSIKNYLCKKLDITKSEDVEEILKIDFDCLVNQAGIGVGGSILDLDIARVRENFEINFFSSFELLQAFVNRQKKNNKRGKVVITSSLLSILPFPFLGSYASTKAAITMMAQCLRLELKKINYPISIKLIEPGAYHTGFNQIMLNNKEGSMENSLFFKELTKEEILCQNKLFSLIEKKSLRSIVKKMTKAIESNSNKFKYRAPFLQALGAKLYLIFIK